MSIKVAKRFFNRNYISFHFHYHCLISPTKRAVSIHNINNHFGIALKWVKANPLGGCPINYEPDNALKSGVNMLSCA